MAATYDILSQMPVLEFMPPNRTRTMTEITAQAQPSGVVFYFRVTPSSYNAANIKMVCASVAGALNKDSNVPGVIGLRIEQDVGQDGQLVEYGIATVESSTGNSQTEIRKVQTWLFLDTFDNQVAAARKKLDDIEGL